MAFHKNRVWHSICQNDDPDHLAEQLNRYTWCCCNGFRYENYLLLNDSTSPDGAQEYCVVKADTLVMIESVTISWMSLEEIKDFILRLMNGDYDGENYGSINPNQISSEMTVCYHCM